jgi:copper chaperone CopZ
MAEKRIILDIEGMSCAHCKNTVRNAIKDVKGVLKAEVDLANHTANVEFEDELTSYERIVDAVNSTGVYRVKEKTST